MKRKPAERPTAAEIARAHRLLLEHHGEPPPRSPSESVLDALVETILSQNTTDANSGRAFAALKARFPTWDEARAARPSSLAAAIRHGGLARVKARRIRAILRRVHRERGETSLEHLREASDEELRAALASFPGVGPKTVACVLMFHLARPDFPVDTHVHRVAQRLGWVAARASAERAYEHLLARVPEAARHPLHVLMVWHGRSVCRARRPLCGECVLRRSCDHGRLVAG
jgi:endonuclease-3